MFSFTIGTFVCFCAVFDYAIFWFVAGSSAVAASLGLPAVHFHMSKAMTLEALVRLSITLEKLAGVG